MTLNLTLVHPSGIVQVSDRRLVNYADGRLMADDANKAVIIRCRNASLAITFSGIGGLGTPSRASYRGVDDWLAESAQDAGIAELGADDAVEFVRSEATDWFRRNRIDQQAHTFVVAGWVDRSRAGPPGIPTVWRISNVDRSGSLRSSFETQRRSSQFGSFLATGNAAAITRESRRLLGSRIRAATTAEDLVDALVVCVRRAAGTAVGSTIGASCLVVLLAPDGRCVTCSLDSQGVATLFGPHVLWVSGDRSVLAVGPEASAGNLGIVLGDGTRQTHLLGGRIRARIAREGTHAGQVQAKLRFGVLRHSEPVGSSVGNLIGLVRLEDP